MGEDGRAGRRYNEKQVGALIQRATELHEERTGQSERGLTLTEIEKIAAELGLPVQDMRNAALELETSREGESGLDRPFSVSHSFVVEGEMTEEQWPDVLLELRDFTGRSGSTTQLGQGREWTHDLGEGSEGISFTRRRVLIRPKNGHTSIELQHHYGFARFFYPLGLLAGAIGMLIVGEAGLSQFAMFADLPAIVGLSATALAAGAGAFGAHVAIKSWAEKKKALLGVLAQRLRKALTPEFSSASGAKTGDWGVNSGAESALHSSESTGLLQDLGEVEETAKTAAPKGSLRV